MRPKKRVLLYCRDEFRCSRVAMVLKVKGFAVEQADSVEMLRYALDWCPAFDGALVLDAGEPDYAESVVAAIHAYRRGDGHGVPVLLQPARQRLEVTQAERCLAHGASMQELVDTVRGLCAVKRGPKRSARPIGAQRAMDVAAARKAAVA